MPDALVTAGLLEGVPVASHRILAEPPYSPEPDATTGVLNHDALVRFTCELAAVVEDALAAGHPACVIGGDCSVLLGPALALRRRGPFSLVHIDAHSDFAHAGNRGAPYPTIAGADLAVVTGRGPATLTDIDGLGPYFADADIVQLGEKHEAEAPDYWFPDFQHTAIRRLPLTFVRRTGLDKTLRQLIHHLDTEATLGFWTHVDLDVLDSTLMPAVDSPEASGLTWEELEELLSVLVAHPRFRGLNVGIYDPDLDPDGQHGRRIAALLRRVLLRRDPPPIQGLL